MSLVELNKMSMMTHLRTLNYDGNDSDNNGYMVRPSGTYNLYMV